MPPSSMKKVENVRPSSGKPIMKSKVELEDDVFSSGEETFYDTDSPENIITHSALIESDCCQSSLSTEEKGEEDDDYSEEDDNDDYSGEDDNDDYSGEDDNDDFSEEKNDCDCSEDDDENYNDKEQDNKGTRDKQEENSNQVDDGDKDPTSSHSHPTDNADFEAKRQNFDQNDDDFGEFQESITTIHKPSTQAQIPDYLQGKTRDEILQVLWDHAKVQIPTTAQIDAAKKELREIKALNKRRTEELTFVHPRELIFPPFDDTEIRQELMKKQTEK